MNYLCINSIQLLDTIKNRIMDLQARKYNFMEQLFEIEKESILEALELTLKKEREASLKISTADKKVLDQRLESYKNNPDDLLDWKDVENEW